MNKEEFLDITREFMRNQGFQLLRKSKFYFKADEFVLKIELQHSEYDELYYFNFNVRINELHSQVTRIDDTVEWDLILGRLINSKDYAFIVKYLEVEKEEYLNLLQKKYVQQIEPILDEGLKKLIWLEENNISYIDFKKGILEYLQEKYK